MAELFKNFISKSQNGEKVIVPIAGETVNIDASSPASGELLRDEDSTAQVHSLYISQSENRYRNDDRYDENNFNYVDLFVEDSTTGIKVYLCYDIQIVPGSPYYIEKNITLTPTQCLKINIPASQGVNGSNNINVVASTVLFVEDKEQ